MILSGYTQETSAFVKHLQLSRKEKKKKKPDCSSHLLLAEALKFGIWLGFRFMNWRRHSGKFSAWNRTSMEQAGVFIWMSAAHVCYCWRGPQGPASPSCPRYPPWMFPTLSMAQNPWGHQPLPQQHHSRAGFCLATTPAWPRALLSWAYPWADAPAWPWPLPVLRGLSPLPPGLPCSWLGQWDALLPHGDPPHPSPRGLPAPAASPQY